jgi:hypothetical protein
LNGSCCIDITPIFQSQPVIDIDPFSVFFKPQQLRTAYGNAGSVTEYVMVVIRIANGLVFIPDHRFVYGFIRREGDARKRADNKNKIWVSC